MAVRRTANLIGIGRLLRDAMARKELSRPQLAKSIGMHVNHLHSVMQGLRPLPEKNYTKVIDVLELSQEDIEQAQKESEDYRRQGGHYAVDSILVDARIAQGDISLEQFKMATELAEKFGGKLSFQLFLNLLREEHK